MTTDEAVTLESMAMSKHRFPATYDYVATEAIDGNYYIAYHLDYFTGEFDVDRIAFGHGSTPWEAIDDLKQRTRRYVQVR